MSYDMDMENSSFLLREATSQSPCLHETLAAAVITSETRKACFISF